MHNRGYTLQKFTIPFRILMIFNILSLILLPTGSKPAIAAPITPTILASTIDTTDHTIVIDGDLSDWSADELMETDGPATFYTTWDVSNIYLGLSDVYLGDTAGQDKSFLACFDIDQITGSGASSDGYGNVIFDPNIFAPEYCYYFAGGAGWYEWTTWNGSTWNWNGWRNDGTYYNWPDNPATLPGSELIIIRSEIGNPTSLRMIAWLTPEESPTIEATWPTPNATGTTPTLTHFYHFPSLVNGVSPNQSILADNIIINEFRPKSTEFVELFNPTDQAIDLSGWYIDDDTCGLGTSLIGAISLTPGSYFVVNANDPGDNFDLSNSGDYVYLCDVSHLEIDAVSYGYSGGAPLSHASALPGHSTARTPNGTDTDYHAGDWNVSTAPTPGTGNNAPAVMLGSSVILNEIDVFPSSGNDMVEIYNPTAQVVNLSGWFLSDGDGYAPIVSSPLVDPGGWVVLEEYVDWTLTMDFGSDDVGYLFQPDGIRVDQLGWYGEYEDDTFQRIRDGEGPKDGYDWASSGGGATLYDLPSTMGFSNTSPVSLEITKSAPEVSFPGHLLIYDIAVTNNSIGNDATGVVVTDTLPTGAEYAFGGDVYANGVVTFTVPSEIAWNSTVEYSFAVTVTADYNEYVVNDLYGVDSNETTPVSGEPVTTTISDIDLSIDKQAPNAISQESQYLTYEIDVVNFGVTNAVNVVVTDSLPGGTSYFSDNSGIMPAIPSPGEYVWSFGDMLPDTTLTFNLTVTVDITTPGTVLNNTVVAHTDTPNDIPSNNTDTTTTILYVPIHAIQAESHISPYNGAMVDSVYGIVTVARYNAFYMQDPNADANDATSEAIYVYTGSSPGISVGDEVVVAGTISEYRAGGSGGLNNLTLTEITYPDITILSSGNQLPEAVVIGSAGRLPPSEIIDNDSTGDVEIDGYFDPEEDGIDFYESLESMLVQINDAIAVAATNTYGEIAVVGDYGTNAGIINARSSIVIQEGDFNPERILVDDTIISGEPQVNTGSTFNAPIFGVLDYTFGNFKLFNTIALDVTNNDPEKEIAEFEAGDNQITVATFNVENLDPGDDPLRFDALATQVVTHLLSPDIIAVQEIQDNNGPTDDGTVDADLTFQALIDAIVAAGGPTYESRQINPIDNMDGGEPGGNIRVGFLFRPDRGLEFIDRPGGDPTTPVTATLGVTGIELSFSPGRINPNNEAFLDSRKPLAGEFTFNGNKVIVIANHLNSKSGDQPLFGHLQPPTLYSEVQRIQQATILNNFVQHILSLDAQANVILLGDLNDYQFSAPITTLAGDELVVLTDLLPVEERYTYHYDGNAQALDHILVSAALTPTVVYDIVHLNAEYLDDTRPTDHDPAVAIFDLLPPMLNITKAVTPTLDVPLGAVVTYTISLENNDAALAQGIVLTDILPVGLTFGGWIADNGAQESDGMITWNGELPGTDALDIIFTATIALDPTLYGTGIANVASFVSDNHGTGDAEVTFSVIQAPGLSIEKQVILSNEPALPGDVITYTITVHNAGLGEAIDVHVVDLLPEELIGEDLNITATIAPSESVTFILNATIVTDITPGAEITNTATYTHLSGSGEASAVFTIQGLYKIFIPLILRR